MCVTLQGAPGDHRRFEPNRVATRAWFEGRLPELVPNRDRFARDTWIPKFQTVLLPQAVRDLAAGLHRCPPESFWLPPRCVRSVSASLSKPVPEWSDVPPPSSACNPIAQRAAPIPPTAQWRCSLAHLPARALDPIPRSVRIH